ncbi:hypothetical protein XELAEV_18030289mg [Xenopus laevis]|uniref:Taste receptor type 2 n=1 Tax=Xenopus laevis TaxID=8355 RepID=A0A974CUX7_XENLA|nr:hypothetical protein XELAEV_18030289mg [Xenopus laevis]
MISDFTLAIIAFTQFLLGMPVNGFIVWTFCLEWITNKRLHASDTILMCLGFTRLLMHLFFFFFYSPMHFKHIVLTSIFQALYIFFNTASLWFASFLCAIYCVTVANYSNSLFIYLKHRISRVCTWMVLANLLTSLALSCLDWYTTYGFPHSLSSSTGIMQKNSTEEHGNVTITLQTSLVVYYVAVTQPFLLYCIAALLLLNSLWRHIRRMRSSETSLQSLSVEVQLNVLRKLVVSFFLYAIYYVADILASYGQLEPFWLMFCTAISCFYPIFHSLILIYFNSRLRKACVAMYQRTMSWIKKIITTKPKV